MNYLKWIEEHTHSLSGKNVLITGGTGTLAENASKVLLGLGANLILTARNITKCNNTIASLKCSYPSANIDMLFLDLNNIDSILDFSNNLKIKYPNGIDYLINNAGCFRLPKQKSTLGYDIHFATNFVGTYYLINILLPYLNQQKCKIITVTSITYKNRVINFQDIDNSKSNNYISIYGNSKRFLTLSLFELQERIKDSYKNLKLQFIHPGISATNIIHYSHGGYPKWFYKIAIGFMKAFFTSPKIASLNIIYSIFCETTQYELVAPGGLFKIWGYPKIVFDKPPNKAEQEKAYQIANDIIHKLNA